MPDWYKFTHKDVAQFHVYVLRDPDSNDIRYVGVTSKPEQRKRVHQRAMASHDCRRVMEWEVSLKEQGKQCVFEVIETFEVRKSYRMHKEAYAVEAYWIQAMFLQGHPLLNRTFPGCGTYKEFFT